MERKRRGRETKEKTNAFYIFLGTLDEEKLDRKKSIIFFAWLVRLKVKRKKMNNQSNIFFNLDPNNNQRDPTVDKRGK
jgi:hypothetical protein